MALSEVLGLEASALAKPDALKDKPPRLMADHLCPSLWPPLPSGCCSLAGNVLGCSVLTFARNAGCLSQLTPLLSLTDYTTVYLSCYDCGQITADLLSG